MNKLQIPDYYVLLGIARGSSLQEIKTAFRKLSLMTHPDRGGTNEDQALINHVYEVLSDPARRRRYDAYLDAAKILKPEKPREPEARNEPEPRNEPERPGFKSGHAEEYEQALRRKRVKRNIRERAREGLKVKIESLESGVPDRVEAFHAEACKNFKRIRSRFILSACAALAFTAAGFVFPVLWIGTLGAGYAMFRSAWYGSGDDAVFVAHPEWDYLIKKQVRRQVRLLTDALLGRLDEVSGFLNQLLSDVKRATGAKDPEETVLRRVLIHFFLLGYAPVGRDPGTDIVTLSDGEETIALRCRHREGGPVNSGVIRILHDYMKSNGIRKGFLFAAPGLSRNAAISAENCGIAYFSMREMNAWIERMSVGRYPGPGGDILGRIDDFMKFMERTD